MKIINKFMDYLELTILVNPLRVVFQNPWRILKEIGLRKSMHFIDLGCGPGYLTIPAAEIVGPEGKVYAVDISEKYIGHVKRKMEELDLKNIILLNTEAWRLNAVPPNTIDICLIFLSLHHFSKKLETIFEVTRKLKKGGRLIVYESDLDVCIWLGHGIRMKEIQSIALEAGLRILHLNKKKTIYKLDMIKP